MVTVILIVGGTGQLGGRVARLLLRRGAAVRCLLRWQTDGSALQALGAEIVRGDLAGADGLRAACEGVDTVVTTASAIVRRLAGASRQTIREVDEDGVAALVGLADEAGVEQFVYTSYAGVDRGIGAALEHAKLAVEQRIAQSRLRGVVVRPDSFQEIHLGPVGRFDMAGGKAMVIGRGDNRVRFVATDDIAALLAAVALEPEPPSVIEFGGPEPLSKNEAVELAGELTGRRIGSRGYRGRLRGSACASWPGPTTRSRP